MRFSVDTPRNGQTTLTCTVTLEFGAMELAHIWREVYERHPNKKFVERDDLHKRCMQLDNFQTFIQRTPAAPEDPENPFGYVEWTLNQMIQEGG